MTLRLQARAALVVGLLSCAGWALRAEDAAPGGPVLHVVLFQLKPGAAADAATLIADCRATLKDLPGVVDLRVGRKAADDRPVHVKDYDVALAVRLGSLADLKAYLTNPKHQQLVERWRPKADWRVIDFYAE